MSRDAMEDATGSIVQQEKDARRWTTPSAGSGTRDVGATEDREGVRAAAAVGADQYPHGRDALGVSDSGSMAISLSITLGLSRTTHSTKADTRTLFQ